MGGRSIVHRLGRVATRALLRPDRRERATYAWVYLRLYLLGKWLVEQRERKLLRRLVVPGMVVLDIGCNAGFYALQIARWVGAGGRVLAFEPDPVSYRLLRGRCARARLDQLEPYQLALAAHQGQALLFCSAYNRADNRLHQSHDEDAVEACEVTVTTLDSFLEARGIRSANAIKLDVQGAEEAVLRGARNCLASPGLSWIWMEFSPPHLRGAGSDPAAFLRWLEDLGWTASEIGHAGGLVPIQDSADFLRRVGDDYVDLLLRPRLHQAHGGPA